MNKINIFKEVRYMKGKLNIREFNRVLFLVKSELDKKSDFLARIEKRVAEEGEDAIFLGRCTLGEELKDSEDEYYVLESAFNKLKLMEDDIVSMSVR